MSIIWNPQTQRILPGRSHDAFGRLPVSSPTTLGDYQNQYDTSPLHWDQSTTATGAVAHDANTASVTLSASTNGDVAIRQTRRYHRYQPGKSQFVMITGDFLSAGSLYIVKRSKVSGEVVETAVAQADWNGSKLDGSAYNVGRGMESTLDSSKAQIFALDMEWLGVGSVRTGFMIDGVFSQAHTFHHANESTRTYITTANLPLRYEIRVAAGIVTKRMGYFDSENGFFLHHQSVGTSGSMAAICGTVISEGGFEASRGIPFQASNGSTTIGVTTRRPILSIRPKATFNSIVNRATIVPGSFISMASGNSGYFELVYGGTLTGASFASVDASSTAEVDVAATAISGGISVDSALVPAGANNRVATEQALTGDLPLTLDIDGANPTVLSVVCTSFATTCTASSAIKWTEIR